MKRLYQYVGPEELRQYETQKSARFQVRSVIALDRWMKENHPPLRKGQEVTFTFIVDAEGDFWLAERTSEHVACARIGPVLSAGEITFIHMGSEFGVSAITNQSTGYCPEPNSWPEVASALNRAGVEHPGGFTETFIFRRCDHCRAINLVKEEGWECAICGGSLPESWNLE